MFIFFRCEEGNPVISTEESIVVQAYLYAGESIDDIRLTSTLALGTDTNSAPPINDADVYLLKNDKKYECKLAAGDSGYYEYDGDDLDVLAGDEFKLEIHYNNEVITAETKVPEAPQSISITENEIIVPDFSDSDFSAIREWRQNRENNEVNVNWDGSQSSWYYVTMENIEKNPAEIERMRNDTLRSFVFPPINDDSYRIREFNFTHLGEHKIKVYTVNTEYADLYSSREQDSRDLQEPLTNVENGLGIFTAFNSDSVFLEVRYE